MQTISLPSLKAIAAPVAFVANKARSSTGLSNSSTPSGERLLSSSSLLKYNRRRSGHPICTPPAGLATQMGAFLFGLQGFAHGESVYSAQFPGKGLWITLHSPQSKAHGYLQDSLDPGRRNAGLGSM